LADKVDIKKIDEEIAKVVDPEIGISIADMKLVEKVDINDGNVTVDFHLTAPFCPPVFAIKIASDIKKNVSNIEGVKSVRVNLRNHQMADYINKKVNE
jgi:metal-sulfur cluster biosynthetic enzyme